MSKRTTGLVLGKFLPPTLGHQYLVDFARNYVTDLTVIVGSLPGDPIPGDVRWRWMRELCPDGQVVHLAEEIPQYPHEHPDFWEIWHDRIRRFIPVGPDYVFASEEYGFNLAEVLGARYVPVDQSRLQVPVTGSAVRADPMRYWDYLPACVRPWFLRRICIIGPESTGKTTLAFRLARHHETVMVAEYARLCIDAHGGKVTAEMFELFTRGQAASEAALARQARRLLICDSDAFTTALYHELHYGSRPAYIMDEARRRSYDLYLLTAPDTPLVADPQRYHEDTRAWFFNRCEEWLTERQAHRVVIRGDWETRFQTARAAVDELVAARPTPAS
jgi:HTH-type transcriptional regulator, transcriptional repressor of NAD biosynthesis genes